MGADEILEAPGKGTVEVESAALPINLEDIGLMACPVYRGAGELEHVVSSFWEVAGECGLSQGTI